MAFFLFSTNLEHFSSKHGITLQYYVFALEIDIKNCLEKSSFMQQMILFRIDVCYLG